MVEPCEQRRQARREVCAGKLACRELAAEDAGERGCGLRTGGRVGGDLDPLPTPHPPPRPPPLPLHSAPPLAGTDRPRETVPGGPLLPTQRRRAPGPPGSRPHPRPAPAPD